MVTSSQSPIGIIAAVTHVTTQQLLSDPTAISAKARMNWQEDGMAEFDLIVYGATGFTGRLIADYINATHPDRSWAIAGRSTDKLAAVRDEMGLPCDTDLIVADAADPASIDAMVARGDVIISTVGPYQAYGEPLFAACAVTGTDYVDLSSEPPFMWNMIEKYDAQAKETGTRIVHSCGFDSVPFEIGVYFL